MFHRNVFLLLGAIFKYNIFMKAYITCPITHSQDRLDIKPLIEKVVKECGMSAFVTIVGGTSNEIFERDYGQLKTSDVLIAEVSKPSHGVGMEIGLSYEMGLKRILLLSKGNYITKFAVGMPGTVIIEYSDDNELLVRLKQTLEEIDSIS